MADIFGLEFNPFASAHGGERDSNTGKLTERGKTDFFASAFDFTNSIEAYKKLFSGDISWKDFSDPGSVLLNPAQKIADPGEFFTDNKLTSGEFGDRGAASAIVAGLIYGGGSLLSSGGSGAGEGLLAEGASTPAIEGASTTGLTSVEAAEASELYGLSLAPEGMGTEVGGTSSAGGIGGLFDNKLFLQYLSGAGSSISKGEPASEGLDRVTQQNIAAQSQAKVQKKYIETLAKLLGGEEEIGGGKLKTTSDLGSVAPPPAYLSNLTKFVNPFE